MQCLCLQVGAGTRAAGPWEPRPHQVPPRTPQSPHPLTDKSSPERGDWALAGLQTPLPLKRPLGGADTSQESQGFIQGLSRATPCWKPHRKGTLWKAETWVGVRGWGAGRGGGKDAGTSSGGAAASAYKASTSAQGAGAGLELLHEATSATRRQVRPQVGRRLQRPRGV